MMKACLNSNRSLSACLLILLACLGIFTGQVQAAPADIPQSEITELQQDFVAIKTQTSAAKKRRSCKSLVRKGDSLVEDSPTAPNRFQVLAIMLQSQKQLLGMDNTERNRKSLFEICGRLAQAPDTYANLRLEAELLFSTMKLDRENAGKEERAEALTALMARYRDTRPKPTA